MSKKINRSGITFAAGKQNSCMKKLLFVLVLIPTLLFSQSRKEKKAIEVQQKADMVVIDNLKSHIKTLQKYELDQQSGTVKADETTSSYLASQFQLIGLQPKGTNGYLQSFEVEHGKRIEASTYLKINGNPLQIKKEYIPLAYSAAKTVTGIPAMALRERGVPWFTDIKDWLGENQKNASIDLHEAVRKEAVKVAAKGATALFIYNSSSVNDDLAFNKKDKTAPVSIPVIYITGEGYKKYFQDHSQLLDIDLKVSFKEVEEKASNVVGYIDNNATSNIIIAAHHSPVDSIDDVLVADTSASASTVKSNGISSTAILIELAKMLSASKAKSNNYLFIAFAADNLEAQGSKYWLNHATVTTPANFMIDLNNLDLYNPDKKVSIGGLETSATWAELITPIADKALELTYDNNGTTAATYTWFSQKEIPVLSFNAISNVNDKAAAPAGQINYSAELQIAKFIRNIIETADPKGKVSYTKTATQKTTPVATEAAVASLVSAQPRANGARIASYTSDPKNSVSLGIIPDNINNMAEGLRINGTSPKKLAARIGLQSGDILTYLGTYKIEDVKTYIHALSAFKSGDKTVLRIKRGKENKEFAVEF